MAFHLIVIGIRRSCAVPAQVLKVGERYLGGGLFADKKVLQELEGT